MNRGGRWDGDGMNWYATAIAHRRLGHKEAARRWLARADAWLARIDRDPVRVSEPAGKFWLGDYLDAKVLGREARAGLERPEAAPASGGESPRATSLMAWHALSSVS